MDLRSRFKNRCLAMNFESPSTLGSRKKGSCTTNRPEASRVIVLVKCILATCSYFLRILGRLLNARECVEFDCKDRLDNSTCNFLIEMDPVNTQPKLILWKTICLSIYWLSPTSNSKKISEPSSTSIAAGSPNSGSARLLKMVSRILKWVMLIRWLGKLLEITSITWRLMDATKSPNLEETLVLIVEPIFGAMEPILDLDSEPLTPIMPDLDAHFLVIRRT